MRWRGRVHSGCCPPISIRPRLSRRRLPPSRCRLAIKIRRCGLTRRWRSRRLSPITTVPAEAAFALVAEPAACPTFETFALGLQDYPDRSTTLVLAVQSLSTEEGFILEGPGIARRATLEVAPLPENFEQAWADNRARFPRGVDLLFAARHTMAGLPRSTRIVGRR
jgi:phosphonate C-P lyase system protein PhnH